VQPPETPANHVDCRQITTTFAPKIIADDEGDQMEAPVEPPHAIEAITKPKSGKVAGNR